MKIDPNNLSLQPLIGAANHFPATDENYNTIGGITDEYALQYLTDPDAIQEVLPEPSGFSPGAEPIVTVLHSWFDGTSVVDGGDYALSTVLVNARFDGESDHVEGFYELIMPENNNYAVIIGRDLNGNPKMFADLPRPYVLANGHVRCETRVWNYDRGSAQWQLFFGVDFEPFKEADAATRKQWQAALNATPMLDYQYSPNAEGGVDAQYGCIWFTERQLEQCWVADSGSFLLGENIYESLVLETRSVAALKKLPVRKVLGAVHWRSKMTLKGGKNHILR